MLFCYLSRFSTDAGEVDILWQIRTFYSSSMLFLQYFGNLSVADDGCGLYRRHVCSFSLLFIILSSFIGLLCC
jgi:hypothetical protein